MNTYRVSKHKQKWNSRNTRRVNKGLKKSQFNERRKKYLEKFNLHEHEIKKIEKHAQINTNMHIKDKA